MEKKPRVALYLRLSDEDENKLSKEQVSESIKNQEIMLKNFARKNNWKIVNIYNDEDYSGADASRPEFNKMIKECQKGNIDIVLAKTQARFARDLELIEKYLHNKFIEWNVRFITTVDRIDNTKKETKKTSQILGLTDEWYLEDTSNNIKSTFKTKRENGEFTGSFAPYGYLKDPVNKNHLIVDNIAKEIVKRIYDEYYRGNGLNKIATNLNNDQILSPLEYKKLNGSKLQIPLALNYYYDKKIKKCGTYKIEVSYFNNEKKTIKNLITYNCITSEQKLPNPKLTIKLEKYSKNTKLFYTTKSKKNTIKKEDLITLNEGDIIPKNTTYIITKTDNLDFMHTINYQFEVVLTENKNYDTYSLIIDKYLNKVPTNFNFCIKVRKKFKWSEQTIKKILTDEVYIGNLVQFKTTYVSYKNHTIVYNEPYKWIRVQNTHEAIIEKKLWKEIQLKLKNKYRSTKKGNFHPLANKVFCMNCNKAFCKCGKNNSEGFSYLCCKEKKYKWQNCNNKKYISEKQLHEFILEKLNLIIKYYYDQNIIDKLNNNYKEKNTLEEKFKIKNNELNELNKKLQGTNLYFQKLYENYINNIINKEEFLTLKEKYQDDFNNIKKRISILVDELEILKYHESITTDKTINYIPFKNLDYELVNIFIDKIFIGNINENNNTRKIKIIWNLTSIEE